MRGWELTYQQRIKTSTRVYEDTAVAGYTTDPKKVRAWTAAHPDNEAIPCEVDESDLEF